MASPSGFAMFDVHVQLPESMAFAAAYAAGPALSSWSVAIHRGLLRLVLVNDSQKWGLVHALDPAYLLTCSNPFVGLAFFSTLQSLKLKNPKNRKP